MFESRPLGRLSPFWCGDILTAENVHWNLDGARTNKEHSFLTWLSKAEP
jgi:hypothetical protein